jgi:hypothetical protein
MGKILFRAKRLDNGEWIKGFYAEGMYQANNMLAEHCIIQSNCYPVAIDPKTLGQYRQDLDAFDGDWITAKTKEMPVDHVEGYLAYEDLECRLLQNDVNFPACSFAVIEPRSVVVTGLNIHDNPELLEPQED